MRIAYLCTDLGVPVCGNKGASIHVRELSRALQALGHDVILVCAQLGGRPPVGFDVPVVELPLEGRISKSGDRGLRAAVYAGSLPPRALPLLRDFAPDVLYERYALNGTAGLTLARELEIPHVLEVNAPLVDEEEAHRGLASPDAARAVERGILRRVDRIIAVSGELERWLLGLGIEERRIHVVANAVDPDRFETTPEQRAEVRRRLNVNGTPIVAFVGTLRPWHDPTILVRALRILYERGAAPQLVLVGDGPERERVEALVREEGLSGAVTFVGSVPHDEVPAYLAAADVAVASYHPDTGTYFSPLKLFEYLAAGLPVVAADMGEIPHCIHREKTGLLYPPGNAEALADALAALIADRERAERLGQKGREHVLRHHTWKANASAVVALAEEAMA